MFVSFFHGLLLLPRSTCKSVFMGLKICSVERRKHCSSARLWMLEDPKIHHASSWLRKDLCVSHPVLLPHRNVCALNWGKVTIFQLQNIKCRLFCCISSLRFSGASFRASIDTDCSYSLACDTAIFS